MVRADCPAPWVRVNGMCFAPSSCTDPDENGKCRKDQPNWASVPWPVVESQPETWCSALDRAAATAAHFGHWGPVVLGGKAMLCDVGYPNNDDDLVRGCLDAFGRRVKYDEPSLGPGWQEVVLADRPSGWWKAICPARADKCEPTPNPTPTPTTPGACSLPAMPECGGRQADSDKTHVWGCCISSEHPSFNHRSPYDDVLESVQDAIEQERAVRFDQDGRVDEDEYMTEVVRRLTALGLCVKRSVNPSEEIGIKGSNNENYQYDLVLSNGRPRHRGYTAYCKPARF